MNTRDTSTPTQAEQRSQQLNAELNASLSSVVACASQLEPLLAERAKSWEEASAALVRYQHEAEALDEAVQLYYQASFGQAGGGGRGAGPNDENADPRVSKAEDEGAWARQGVDPLYTATFFPWLCLLQSN